MNCVVSVVVSDARVNVALMSSDEKGTMAVEMAEDG